MESLKIATTYRTAFQKKKNLKRIKFHNLKTVEILQKIVTSENHRKDSKYLRSLLRKLRSSKKLKYLIFTFTLDDTLGKSLSDTIKEVSFGYFLYHSHLVKFILNFNSILSHQKASIWRTVEQNHDTLRKLTIYVEEEKFGLMPMFRTNNKIRLKKLLLRGMKTSDLFLLRKFETNWTTEEIYLGKIIHTKKIEPAVKYFVDTVHRENMKSNFYNSSTMKIHYSYRVMNAFLEVYK